MNFSLPKSGLSNGDVSIALGTIEAFNEMATINVAGYSSGFGFVAPSQAGSRPRRPPTPGAAFRGHSRKARRALPDRPKEGF